MNIKEVEKELLKKMAQRIGEHEFDTKPRGQSFYKSTPWGRIVLHLSFIEHGDIDFDVTVDVAIRFDDLENLVNEHDKFLTKAERNNTFSLGVELGNISEGKQKRWTVNNSSNLEHIAESIMDTFVTVGIPYLEQYSNLENAFEALSNDDRSAWLHQPLHAARAKRAIGIAFLLNKQEKFMKLAKDKSEFLSNIRDFGLQSFLDLKEDLQDQLNSMRKNT